MLINWESSILEKMNPELKSKMMIKLEQLNNISKIDEDENKNNTEYKCVICRDLKYIIDDVTDEASPCKCKIIQDTKERLAKSEISSVLKEKTFNSYDYKIHEECADAMFAAIRFCEEFSLTKESRSIIFCGRSGVGKSHLSIAIANNLIEKGIPVIYMPYREIITKLKQNITDDTIYSTLINKYKSEKVLIIDDLFKGRITESDVNIMFEIINYRYLNQLPIIISTEKTPESILNIDEAIGSRIIEMSKGYIIEFTASGLNYRLNNYSK